MIKIKIKDIIKTLNLEEINTADLEREVKGGYTGDLLSNVMAEAEAGDIWITIQGHQNIIAVALLVDMSGVIIAEDFDIEDKAVSRAEEKGINLLRSSLSAYELAGKLYKQGITS
ncbi:MAG: DRTGG domain-containing protein [Bacillota bacterium]